MNQEKNSASELDELVARLAEAIKSEYSRQDDSKISLNLFFANIVKALASKVGTTEKISAANSTNSNTPTSRDPIGFNGNKGNHAYNSRTAEKLNGSGAETDTEQKTARTRKVKSGFGENEKFETVALEAEVCPDCGGHHFHPTGDKETRDVEELVVTVKKTRKEYLVYECDDCGTRFTAPMSDKEKYSGSERAVYGPFVDSFILAQRFEANTPYNKIRMMFGFMTDGQCMPCEGYIDKVEQRAAKSLDQFYSAMPAIAVQHRIICWDDTVINNNGEQSTLRVYCNDHFAYYTVSEHKDMLSLVDDGILTSLTGRHTVMHDHFKGNYNDIFFFCNIECNSHPMRQFVRIYEETEHQWPARMQGLLSELIAERKVLMQDGHTSFCPDRLNKFFSDFEVVLADGMMENEALKKTDFGYDHERLMLSFLDEYQGNLFLWTTDFSLPVTDNESERCLRNGGKRANRISGLVKSMDKSLQRAKIETYLQTCRKNGIGTTDAINRLAEGNPYTVQEVFGIGDDLVIPNGIPMKEIEAQKEKSKSIIAKSIDKLIARREQLKRKRVEKKEKRKATVLEKRNNRKDKILAAASAPEIGE